MSALNSRTRSIALKNFLALGDPPKPLITERKTMRVKIRTRPIFLLIELFLQASAIRAQENLVDLYMRAVSEDPLLSAAQNARLARSETWKGVRNAFLPRLQLSAGRTGANRDDPNLWRANSCFAAQSLTKSDTCGLTAEPYAASHARRCLPLHCISGRIMSQASAIPRLLSSDHDPLFEFHRWKANLRVLEIQEIKTVPDAPLSHPFYELPIAA